MRRFFEVTPERVAAKGWKVGWNIRVVARFMRAMDDDSKKMAKGGDDGRSMLKYWIGFGLACLFVVIVWWWGTGWLTNSIESVGDKGSFGDRFGSVNALFTGLAFAGVVVTLWMQTIEIRQQFKEFRESTEANERHAEISRLSSLLSSYSSQLDETTSNMNNLAGMIHVDAVIRKRLETDNRSAELMVKFKTINIRIGAGCFERE